MVNYPAVLRTMDSTRRAWVVSIGMTRIFDRVREVFLARLKSLRESQSQRQVLSNRWSPSVEQCILQQKSLHQCQEFFETKIVFGHVPFDQTVAGVWQTTAAEANSAIVWCV